MFEIAIPLMLGAGLVIGYLFGKYDQRGWLAEQYKIACWQRDQAMSQRDEAISQRDEAIRQNIDQIWRENK